MRYTSFIDYSEELKYSKELQSKQIYGNSFKRNFNLFFQTVNNAN
jgi:hypothetical protein